MEAAWARARPEASLRFEMTCVTDVCGSKGVLQASIRVCRFEPLPEMRTRRRLWLDLGLGGGGGGAEAVGGVEGEGEVEVMVRQ